MRWQKKVFGPMRQRTLENAQLHHLSTRYDLSPQSRLGKAIIDRLNDALDREEKHRGIRRVRTGELLLETPKGHLILPLRTEEDLDRLISGERWDGVRKDILQRCTERYRELFADADLSTLAKFRRGLFQGRAPRKARRVSPYHGPRKERPWDDDPSDYRMAVEKNDISNAPAQESLLSDCEKSTANQLQGFLDSQAGTRAVQEPMLLELMALRARFYPRISQLESGQMPLCAMGVESGRALHLTAREQPMKPVVVSVLAGDEYQTLRNNPPNCYDDYLEFNSRRIARVLTEAYMQDGLLSFSELQWIFLLSQATVSRAVDFYHRKHQVILPCPGTVLDMGKMLTHKDLIVRLHLQGLSVMEISRKTYHSPRSVDAYLRVFDSVLILNIYGVSAKLMSRVLRRGQYLVDEHLELIEKHLKTPQQMRQYLKERGVQIPV